MLNLIVSDLIIEGQPVSEIRIRKETAKYGSERYIPVSGRLRTILLDMYIFCWKAGQFSPSNYAFISDRVCNHITITQVERIIDSAGLKALQRHLHPHMLRHTFATRLMRVSNIRVVQQLLGHKYLTSTQIYTHPDSTDLRTAIEATQTSV
jgi:integrase/recombinase XerC